LSSWSLWCWRAARCSSQRPSGERCDADLRVRMSAVFPPVRGPAAQLAREEPRLSRVRVRPNRPTHEHLQHGRVELVLGGGVLVVGLRLLLVLVVCGLPSLTQRPTCPACPERQATEAKSRARPVPLPLLRPVSAFLRISDSRASDLSVTYRLPFMDFDLKYVPPPPTLIAGNDSL